MKRRSRLIPWQVWLLIVGWLLAAPVQAALKIDITAGADSGAPIAVVPFDGDLPVDVASIVSADLARSGRFAPMPVADMPERPSTLSDATLSLWRGAEMEYLVVGRAMPAGSDWRIEFYLVDVGSGDDLIAHAITARDSDLRAAAHRIADLVFEKVTGIRGAFSTRIAYVTEFRQADGERRYALEVADADGYGPKTVLESARPIMSPTWSPDGGQLAYVSFEGGSSGIWVQDLGSGDRYRLTDFPGINGAPAWSPDGNRIAVTLSGGGSPNIYVIDLQTRELEQVTRGGAIDTEAAWMPDGEALVFTSNRSGQAQIYMQRRGDNRARRLSFDSPYMAGPAVSPDGKYVAGVVSGFGGFRVGVQNIDTGALRVISDQGHEERPSFSPNGVMLVYATRERGRSVLRISPVTGEGHQTLSFEKGLVRDAAWGPYR
ncbi:MAG: Tol-Pal system beta propeller repeat protein TolB [Halothiobacillaceae bacterium]